MAVHKPRTQPTTVWRQGNVITFYDLKHHGRTGDFVNEIHKARLDGHHSFVIELPNTEAAFPNACVPLAALISHYRDCGLEIAVNHGSDFCGIAQINQPVIASLESVRSLERRLLSTIWEFHDSYMICRLVTGFVQIISKQAECKAGVLHAFEWCLNEIMDNVVQHSGQDRGFVAVQIHPLGNTLAICIADAGMGIYRSLLGSSYKLGDAVSAIRLATKKGVTRDSRVGAGNGLWGLMQIVKSNSGTLAITSGAGALRIQQGAEATSVRIPYPDRDHQCTFVDFQLDISRVIDIGATFGGDGPLNLRLEPFETDAGEHRVALLEHAQGTGTRRSGQHLRTLVYNILNEGVPKVAIDFTNVRMVSSSFADELVGGMATRLGVQEFERKIGLCGMNDDVRIVVAAVLSQRIRELSR